MARGPACCAEPLILRKTRFFTRIHFTQRTLSRTYQPACKPGSVGHRRAHRATIRDGHSSGTMFAHGLKQPTRTASLTRAPAALSPFGERPALPSLFGLAPGGVYHAGSVAGAAVRSCRTFSPLLAPSLHPPQAEEGGGSGSFSVALSLGLPPPDVIRHRMSMEPGLSSPAAFRHLPERPSSRLTLYAWGFGAAASSRTGPLSPLK
jgi:hypothetical protein